MKKLIFITLLFCTFFSTLSHGQSSIISGRVFNDNILTNNSYDAGEELSGITVWLFDLNAVAPYYRVTPINAAVTDGSGAYSFSGVVAGDYQIRVRQSTIPTTITRAVMDNDAYPNGLTIIMGVDGTTAYTNIDFGFAPTAVAPGFTSTQNFQWNASNSFVNQTLQTYNLATEVYGGNTYYPTITWTTDRTNAPGGTYGTDIYPQAAYSGASLGKGFPGNNKGGIHPTDNTFQLMFGGAGYTNVNNDRQTTTIQFSHPVINTKFSIYDVDHADPQVATGRIDHIKVTGYDGATPVMPVLVNPSSAPWNTVSGNTVYGFADYSLDGYTLAYNSQNEDHGTVNVYFQSSIDKIEIEYEEWAPVLLPGKGINDASIPNTFPGEASWSSRSAPTAPTTRGTSISSIDYTFDIFTVLPVSLVNFEATQSGCNATLNWQTSTEQSLDFFGIEYSTDAVNFQLQNTVKAKNISSGSHYQYAVSGSGVKNYYRLKMADKDGKYQFSNIVSIAPCKKDFTWRVTPNPIKKGGEISVTVFSAERKIQHGNLVIYDANGKIVIQKNNNIIVGTNLVTVKSNKMAAGIYLIALYDENKKTIGNSQKIIIK
jgi:hypothetical protein